MNSRDSGSERICTPREGLFLECVSGPQGQVWTRQGHTPSRDTIKAPKDAAGCSESATDIYPGRTTASVPGAPTPTTSGTTWDTWATEQTRSSWSPRPRFLPNVQTGRAGREGPHPPLPHALCTHKLAWRLCCPGWVWTQEGGCGHGLTAAARGPQITVSFTICSWSPGPGHTALRLSLGAFGPSPQAWTEWQALPCNWTGWWALPCSWTGWRVLPCSWTGWRALPYSWRGWWALP